MNGRLPDGRFSFQPFMLKDDRSIGAAVAVHGFRLLPVADP